jgi:hypothetical protein
MAQTEKGEDVTWPDQLNQKRGEDVTWLNQKRGEDVTWLKQKRGRMSHCLNQLSQNRGRITWPDQLNQKRGRLSNCLSGSIRKEGGSHGLTSSIRKERGCYISTWLREMKHLVLQGFNHSSQ